MFIKTSELPRAVRNIVKELMNVNIVEIICCVEFKNPTNWNDYNCMKLVAVNEATGEYSAISYGNYECHMNWTPVERALYAGEVKTVLAKEAWIIVTNTMPRSVQVYVHPDKVAKLLPTAVELTELETKTLGIVKSCKAAYRLEECRWQNISKRDYLAAIETLKSKGLLNKAGALTLEGKNWFKTSD